MDVLNQVWAIIFHARWVRELVLVELIILVLFLYVRRFRAYAQNSAGRTRVTKLSKTIGRTRIVLFALVLIFAGTLVYDRVLPHWGMGAEEARIGKKATMVQAEKSAASSSSSESTSASKLPAAKSSSKKPAAVASSIKAANTGSMNSEQAVSLISRYYGDGATYHFITKTVDANGVTVYQVGRFDSDGTLKNLYYVHKDGNFDIAY